MMVRQKNGFLTVGDLVLSEEETNLLRYWFVKERDEALKRYRSRDREYRSFVVYPMSDPDFVRVVNEVDGQTVIISRKREKLDQELLRHQIIAEEFFATV